MDRVSLEAVKRDILGKKVKNLRADGKLPGHVFGKGVKGENVTVDTKAFLTILSAVGESGLLDLKIGAEEIRPVLVRGVAHHPVTGQPLNVDFYQVNLTEKVKVSVPLILIGDEPETVHLGEAIVLQTVMEVEVEALPTDLVEKIEVDISPLKQIDDAITVAQLNYDRSKLTIHADPEEIVVKLAPAVSAEMEQLLEEQAAEVAEAQAEEAAEKGAGPEPVEGVAEGAEGEAPAEAEEEAPAEPVLRRR